MDMDLKRKQLEAMKKKLERLSLCSSKTLNRRVCSDYDSLKEMYDLMGEDFDYACYLGYYNMVYDKDAFYPKKYKPSGIDCSLFVDGRSVLDPIDRYIDVFKSSGFEFFNNPANIKISRKDRNEIMRMYLDYILPNGAKLFDKSLENLDVLCSNQLNDNYGVTFDMSLFDSCLVFVSSDLQDSAITYMSTIIHELMHKYSADIMRDYSSTIREASYFGNTCEAMSVYSEISFLDFLIKNGIYTDKATFTLNNTLYTFIEFYLARKYLLLSMEQGSFIDSHGYDYEICNDKPIIDGEKGSIWCCDDTYSMGDYTSFRYILGFAKAFDFVQAERDGENLDRLLRDFIATSDDNSKEFEILENEKNDDLIREIMSKNTADCKKLYRYK